MLVKRITLQNIENVPNQIRRISLLASQGDFEILPYETNVEVEGNARTSTSTIKMPPHGIAAGIVYSLRVIEALGTGGVAKIESNDGDTILANLGIAVNRNIMIVSDGFSWHIIAAVMASV